MKKSVLMMLMLLVSISFAQDYKIEDFKPDSLSTWQIYATGGLSGDTYTQEDSYDEDEYSGSEFQINPTVRFNYKKIRKMYEMDYTIYSGLGFSTSKEEDNEDDYNDETTLNSIGFSLSGSFENTRYLTEKFGLVGNIDFLVSNSNYSTEKIEKTDDYKSVVDSDDDYFRISIDLYPGVSFGRMYEGKYSAKTMEILDELRKADHLKRELTKQEYIEFSQILMEKYASYHFDNRIKKMELLEAILTYLRDKNIIAKDEIQPVLITEDICSYDYLDLLFDRKFGAKFYATGRLGLYKSSFDLNDKYTYNGEIEENKSWENPQDWRITGVTAGFLYSKIISWNLFYDLGVTGHYSNYQVDDKDIIELKIDNEEYEFESEYSQNQISTEIYGNFYYQINSRSMANFSTSFNYIKNNYDYDKDIYYDIKNSEYYSFENGLDFIYFLTPKFSINCGVSDYYQKYWDKTIYIDDDNYKYGYWYNHIGFSLDFDYYL